VKTKRAVLTLAILVSGLSAGAFAAERVELTVDMAGIKLTSPHPVRSGVPFAEGKVRLCDNIRLLKDGREIEAQTRALAYWPDRSLKWVLLDFLARDGDKVVVEYGPGVVRRKVTGGIKVTKDADAITLDTGQIRMSVRRGGTAFIDELAFDRNGNGRYDADETVITPPAADEQRYFLDFVHRPMDSLYPTLGNHMPGGMVGKSKVEITELALEEEGPLHCVVLIRGVHRVPLLAARVADEIKYEGQSDFTMRLHVWKDLAVVEGEAHFVFDGCGDDDFIKGWGVRFKADTGMTFTTRADGGEVNVMPEGGAPFTALTQTSADGYKVWQADADRLGETVRGEGKRSAGWVDLSTDRWGVTVGTRWFWQRWPNAIHYDSATGEVAVMLYPPETVVCDLRRYARREWGVGETYAPEGALEEFAPFASKGTANSKEFRIVFHRGKADLARTAQDFQVFNRRAIAKAPPEHYSGTRVLGYFAPRVKGTFDWYEQMTEDTFAEHREGQEKARWYGMWDYGDYQQRFGNPGNISTHRYGRWENDWGRWGWGGGDGHGRVDRALFMAFLRTGNRTHFEQGEAHVRHRSDADIRETREFPWSFSPQRKIPSDRTEGPWWDLRGCVSRHGVQHWSGAYVGARGGNPLGQRIYYYLTGNGRTADILDIIAEAGMVRGGWDGHKVVLQRLGSSGGGDGMAAACLQGVLIKWERTGEAKYQAMLAKAVRPGNDVYARMYSGGRWASGYFIPFGGCQAITEYYDLSNDPQARTIIIASAEQQIDAQRAWSWPGTHHQLVAAAYRLKGSPELKKLAEDMVELQKTKGMGFNVIDYIPFQIEAFNLRAEN